jgi:DNA gyrase subunit A
MSQNINAAIPISITKEMRRSYLDYSMSVIVGRALPDCRDGLKPVHRRILFAMHQMNNYHDKPYKKAARVVGEVIGKYHPHGDSSIYMALVRMAQDFSLRETLVDGQGNFGSVDGDSPAAMRYTEARLSKIAARMLDDIDKDTVNFQDNYDGSESEPMVLPTRFPNLLVNGASGIAVGMATNIPTHNLGEVLDACAAYISNPEISAEDMADLIPAPDFPTGGIILGARGARQALITGHGGIIVRGKVDVEEIGGSFTIVIKELPYQVNKSELVKKIENLVRDKIIEGISEIRDESNKLGLRVAVELRRDVNPEVVINQLYRHTELQTSFGVNMLALRNGQPMMMGIRDVIEAFVEFRRDVVTRRTMYELGKARDKAHILIGVFLAVANIDRVIAVIKSSANPQEAKRRLMEEQWDAGTVMPLLALVDDYRNKVENGKCNFTQEQAEAILEMRLSKLTNLEKDKIDQDLVELAKVIAGYLELLGSRTQMDELILTELMAVKEQYATPRKTEIAIDDRELNDEDLIAREEMVITNTMGGYIKRVPLATYRAQKRGGKGRSGMTVYDDDATKDIIVASTHAPLLFFSSFGKVYRMKVYKLPVGSPQSKGRALINMLPLEQHERITAIMPLPEDASTWGNYNIIFATKNGNIRRSDMKVFENINAAGKIAIRLDEGDDLVGVSIAKNEDHVFLCTKHGKAIRFPLAKLRVVKGRNTDGVRGVTLAASDDAVVSMAIIAEARSSVEQRDEYLKIPDAIRITYLDSGNTEEFMQSVKECGIVMQNLTMEAALELASAEQYILSVTENGYAKRTSIYEYRVTNRGGSGVANISVSERNGLVVSSMHVSNSDEILLLTSGGTLIRTDVSNIRITGRGAQGVKVMTPQPGEKVISVSKIAADNTEEDTISDNVIDVNS